MLKKGQVGAFRNLRGTIGTAAAFANAATANNSSASANEQSEGQISKCRCTADAKEAVEAKYNVAIAQLGEVLERDATGSAHS
jgi:hypothetical protein